MKQQISIQNESLEDLHRDFKEKQDASNNELKQLKTMIEQQEQKLSDENVKASEKISAAEAMTENLKSIQGTLEREKAELQQQLDTAYAEIKDLTKKHEEDKNLLENKLKNERLTQESALKSSEVEKLNRIKDQLNSEKNLEI